MSTAAGKKRRYLVVGMVFGANDAVSAIMTELLKTAPDYYQFDCIGFCDYKSKEQRSSGNINNFALKNVFGGRKHLYYWVKQTFNSLGHKTPLLASSYLHRKLNRLNHSYNAVIALSSGFAYTNASYRYAKQYQLPLVLVWFDSFLLNPLVKNTEKMQKLQNQWIAYAQKVLYNQEDSYTKGLISNGESFAIPIFESKGRNGDTNEVLLYGGTFNTGIRSPEPLFRLVEQLKGTGMRVVCHSNLSASAKNQSDLLELAPLIRRSDYLQECRQAKALICIGNSHSAFQPSKYLEAIGLHKPVIGLNIPMQSELRHYPFFIDANRPDWITRLNQINQNDLVHFDPYSVFPERNPDNLLKQILI